MTYARKGPDSNVTVFGDGEHIYCANCELKAEPIYTEELDGPKEMLRHLDEHRARGHEIPARLIARLEAEASGRGYDPVLDDGARTVVRGRERVTDMLRRLRGAVGDGKAAEAGAYREMLLAALDEAGAPSLEAEFRVLLERAGALLGEVYATLDPPLELRSDIDAWLQDADPLRKPGAPSPLHKVRDVLSNTPSHELTATLLHELESLLDGFLTVAAFDRR